MSDFTEGLGTHLGSFSTSPLPVQNCGKLEHFQLMQPLITNAHHHKPKTIFEVPGVVESDPGSVEDFCTTGREVPKKLHLSPPPEPSFPPMMSLLLELVLLELMLLELMPLASAEERDKAGLRPNQLL